jgi:hypothetical protein
MTRDSGLIPPGYQGARSPAGAAVVRPTPRGPSPPRAREAAEGIEAHADRRAEARAPRLVRGGGRSGRVPGRAAWRGDWRGLVRFEQHHVDVEPAHEIGDDHGRRGLLGPREEPGQRPSGSEPHLPAPSTTPGPDLARLLGGPFAAGASRRIGLPMSGVLIRLLFVVSGAGLAGARHGIAGEARDGGHRGESRRGSGTGWRPIRGAPSERAKQRYFHVSIWRVPDATFGPVARAGNRQSPRGGSVPWATPHERRHPKASTPASGALRSAPRPGIWP